MRHKLLFLIILLLSIYLFCIVGKTVGVTDIRERILVRVAEMKVDLTVSTDKNEYCPGDSVNVTNTLKNVGTLNTTGNLTTRILDSTELHSYSWSNIELLVGENETYNTSYIVQGTEDYGNYYADSDFVYDGKSSYSRSDPFLIKIGKFRVSPAEIKETIPPSKSKIKTITLLLEHSCENVTVILNTSTGDAGNWVSFSRDEVFLSPIVTENTTGVNITVPPTASEGVYYGTIYAWADFEWVPDQMVSIPLNITVSRLDFDLDVTVPEETKKVCPGEGVYAEVNITKYYPPGTIYINMTYQILNETTILDEKNEINISINETPLLRKPILVVPASAVPMHYTYKAILQYNLTVIESSDTFEVIPCLPPPPPPTPPAPRRPVRPPIITPTYAITLNLSTDLLTVFLGNRTSFIAYVKNIGTDTVKSIKISVEGIPSDWITILPSMIDISPREVEEYLVIIDVPRYAKIGVYELKVQAVDTVESEIRTLKLIVGRNPKEIADLLLTELDRMRANANESLAVEDCIDITIIKTFYHDAELAREKGLEEYKKENYGRAINWFEYAIPVHEKVVYRVDITLEMEIETSNASRVVIPPVFNAEEQFLLAGSYLDEKNYENICDPIVKIRNFIMMGLIFWPAIIIFFIVLLIMFIILYRRKRRREREKILEKVRKRLGKPPEEETKKQA